MSHFTSPRFILFPHLLYFDSFPSDTEDMLDTHRRYSHDLDIHDSSGSGSGSGGSIHTPSTVHTAIISILPPTTASTAYFPLDIFPSPPKSYNERGPLRSRPSTPERYYGTSSNRDSMHRLLHPHLDGSTRRRYSEPTGSSSREASIEQRRFTMSFDIIAAPSKLGAGENVIGNAIQERVVRVGFPRKRRSSIGSTSVSSLRLHYGKTGGDYPRGDREKTWIDEWQEKRGGVSNSSAPENKGSVGTGDDGARVCVYDFVEKDKVPEESDSSAPLSSPSLPTQVPPTVISTDTTHAPLWPSLPSGPSSPNSNFTSYTRQQDILPPGRVLSGFSDINYSSCSFSVDDHDHEDISGVKGDISPTIPIIPLRPDIESAAGILHRPRPVPPRNRARPAPLPLALSSKTLPPIPSTPDISPIISLYSITQTISGLNAINTIPAGNDCDPTQSVIDKHEDSLSALTGTIQGGRPVNKESETYPTRTKPCFEKTTSLPSTRNLPLAEIARPDSPSNAYQYHPSTRAKGNGASIIDSGSLLVSGSTKETTVPILASPISIYSQHTSSSSPASMPLSLNRSHQDWDQQGEQKYPSTGDT